MLTVTLLNCFTFSSYLPWALTGVFCAFLLALKYVHQNIAINYLIWGHRQCSEFIQLLVLCFQTLYSEVRHGVSTLWQSFSMDWFAGAGQMYLAWSLLTLCKWRFWIGNCDKYLLWCKWLCLFLKFSTYTEQGLVLFAFSSEHFVLGNCGEGIETWIRFLSVTVPMFCWNCCIPPWCQEGRRCSHAAPLPPCYPQPMLQQGVMVVRLQNPISSPPILDLSPGNSTTKWARWGQKGMSLLSCLFCDFYVCSKTDSTAWKISCKVICLIVHLLLCSINNSECVLLLYY